jgi:2-polyprenyl-6-methoxyphenol hydroxylase-like FAD-dependent oxidoreductase
MVREVDVLIVGSGPSGTSTALHLVQQDPSWAERIVVVDKASSSPREAVRRRFDPYWLQRAVPLGLHFEPQQRQNQGDTAGLSRTRATPSTATRC